MINREKSSKMKKIIAGVLAGGIIFSSGLTVFAENKNDEQLQHHFGFVSEQAQYYENVRYANMEEYDEDFVDLYRNGKLIIDDQEYDLAHIYLVYDEDKTNVVCSANPNEDIITHDLVESSRGKNVLIFKDSSIFFDIYSSNSVVDGNLVITEENKEEIANLFEGYDGSVHREVPETFYKYIESFKHMK